MSENDNDPFACFDSSTSSDDDDDDDDANDTSTPVSMLRESTSDHCPMSMGSVSSPTTFNSTETRTTRATKQRRNKTNHHRHHHHHHHNHHHPRHYRDVNCGVLSFHPNTETSLLAHVQNRVVSCCNDSTLVSDMKGSGDSDDSSSSSMAKLVLDSIDEFCYKRHWMMHIGPEKGQQILSKTLQNVIQTFLSDVTTTNNNINNNGLSKRFTCVELGTYCGYASIIMGGTLRRMQRRLQLLRLRSQQESNVNSVSDDMIQGVDIHLYTIEIDPNYASIALELIQLAKLNDFVTVILVSPENNDNLVHIVQDEIEKRERKGKKLLNSSSKSCILPSLVADQQVSTEKESSTQNDNSNHNDENDTYCQEAISCSTPIINFLFLDHDKDLYLHHLKQFEHSLDHLDDRGYGGRNSMIRKGTCVVADNVIFAQIDDYLSYVQNLARRGIVQTRTIESRVEYSSDDFKSCNDGDKGSGNADDAKGQCDTQQQNTEKRNIFRDGVEVTIYLKDPE